MARSVLTTGFSAIYAGALLFVAPVLAEPFFLSEPGLCDVDEGVVEDMDAIYLTKTGIANHSFGCAWPVEVGEAIFRGDRNVTTVAECGTATETWQAQLEIVKWDDNSVRVFQHSGGISPVRFFRCDGSSDQG